MSSFELSLPHMSMRVDKTSGDNFPATVDDVGRRRLDVLSKFNNLIAFNQEVSMNGSDVVVCTMDENGSSLQ